MRVIGWLSSGSMDQPIELVSAFRQGLGEAGFAEPGRAAIQYRWAEGRSDRSPMLAADLVRNQVAVIATAGAAATRAAKAATATIPVVFSITADPVREGFVASLSRPGGNLTGTTSLASELGPKRLELLHEILPDARVMTVLANLVNGVLESQSRGLRAAAGLLGLRLQFEEAGLENDFDAVFADVARLRPRTLLISTDLYFLARTTQLAALAARYGIASIKLHSFL